MTKNRGDMQLFGLVGAMVALVSTLLALSIVSEAKSAVSASAPPKAPVCGKTQVAPDGTVTKFCRVYGSEWFTFTWGSASSAYRVEFQVRVAGRFYARGNFYTAILPSYYSVNPRQEDEVLRRTALALNKASVWTLKVTATPLSGEPLLRMALHLRGEPRGAHVVLMHS